MPLRLVMGRAGTGKTRTCLEEIAAQMQADPWGPPLIFIVPAQATFNMERELAARGGSIRAQVYSFKRLAFRVLRETGGAADYPVTELGRRMILKNILLDHKQDLHLLGALHNRPGFLASLSEIIGEFKTCKVLPEHLDLLLDKTYRGGMEMKLQDLSFVYSCLGARLADRLTDPDDYLDLLAEYIPAAAFLTNCRVWIDGFVSFTPQEWTVLERLLEKAGDITLTLCIDRDSVQGNLPAHHPFTQSKETFDRVRRLAGKKGLEVKEFFLNPGSNSRFAAAPELLYLEKNFFHYQAPPYRDKVERLTLTSGVNLRAEVEGVARATRRLLRDEGLRLREIMIAVRDVDVYFPLLRKVLADYEIPFFIDHRRPVMHHPLVELLRSSLEVWQSQWSYEPVFRYLKSGLTRVSREEADLLENYVLAAGIRGSSWYNDRPWHYVPERLWAGEKPGDENATGMLDSINRIRRKAVTELRGAQLKMHEAGTGRPRRVKGREWARILLELCLDLDVPRRLDEWSTAARDSGKPDLSREHRQIWKLVGGLLDEFVEVLGDAGLTSPEVMAVLDSGLEAVHFSQIPPGPDAVTVGSVERSRPPGDIKALFIPGLTESSLPANTRRYGVLTEKEREELSHRLAASDHDMLPGPADSLHREQYLIYRVLSRTGGYLWLSYPLGDNDGRAVTPSPVCRRLQELFPALDTGFLPAEPPGGDGDIDFAEHPAALVSRIPLHWREWSWGREVHPLWWRCCNILLEQERWASKLGVLVNGFAQRNVESPLGNNLAFRIWGRKGKRGKTIPGSVSRLERFVKCPFSHFLAHGLGLRERVIYKLGPPDTGQLYHEAMRRFVEYVCTTGPGWDNIQGEDVEQICSRLVDELAPRLQGNILLSSARLRRQKERLTERVAASACALVEQLQNSGLRPAALEVYFGPKGNPVPLHDQQRQTFWPELFLPPLEIELGEGVSLTLGGRIDRVDLGADEKGFYLSVVDYKSGPEKLDLGRVLAGEQLQLLVYLWVALQYFAELCSRGERKMQPAGAFYFSVHRPVLDVDNPDLQPDLLAQEWLKHFKLSGWLVDNGGDFFRLIDKNLGPGLASWIIPAALKKDGNISGRQKASVYTPGELEVLLNCLGDLLRRVGKHMVQGRVDIAPLKSGQNTACRFCPYGPVCRFDPWLPENCHRTLNHDNKELRRRLEQQAPGKEGNPLVLYDLD